MSRPLHFTIGTASVLDDSSEQPSLMTDLLLVKAALLYADRVRLCSIGSSLAVRLLTLDEATRDEKLDWLERFFKNLRAADPAEATSALNTLRYYRQLLNKSGKRQLRTPERREMLQMQNALTVAWQKYRDGMGQFARKAGAESIVDAVDSGLLDLYQFSPGKVETLTEVTPHETARKQELLENLTLEFFDLIAEAVTNGSTHPLFDILSGEMLRAGVDIGALVPSESGVARGRHSGLASDLLQRLPLFERATIQEILDIRRELESPLVRFRAAVVGFSEDIRSAAWDKDFASDADLAFRKEVEPAVLDLEEVVRSNSELGELMLRGFRPEDVATGLVVMYSSLGHLPAVAAVALGSGVTTAITGRKAYKEWRESRANIETKQLYFYYRTRERLRHAKYA